MMSRLFIALLICSIASLSYGAASPAPVPNPPELPARSYLLADFHSGRILVAKNIDVRIEPASITKIMTAYVIYQTLAKGLITRKDLVTVSEKAWRMQGSRMFLEVGKQVSVENLLKGLIIQSGNDASVALAEYVAGSEESFVSMMNTEAERLGMTGTHYVNSTGMPKSRHYTTARDILLLTRALIRDFPEEYKLYSQQSFVFNGITQSNRNRLLWIDKHVDGVKTGHTQSAGYCLVASAVEKKMRLISVVLGTDSDKARSAHSRSLLKYGFRFFETRLLYNKAQKLSSTHVWKGDKENVALGLSQDLFVTYPRGQYEQLNVQLDRLKVLQAPVEASQNVGSITVNFNNTRLLNVPLVTLNSVEEGSFIRRMIDNVLLMFE